MRQANCRAESQSCLSSSSLHSALLRGLHHNSYMKASTQKEYKHFTSTPRCTQPHTVTPYLNYVPQLMETHFEHTNHLSTPGCTRAVITTPCRALISSGVDSNAVMVSRSHTLPARVLHSTLILQYCASDGVWAILVKYVWRSKWNEYGQRS